MDNQETTSTESKSGFSWAVPISILIAGVLIGGAIWFKSGGDSVSAPGRMKVEVGSLPVLGDDKAPVALVEFGDYQCPFCGRQFLQVEPLIRDQYIKTGQAKMYWRDFAFLGPESFWASEAARCANDQGRFWQYHDLLFNRQSGENEGAFSKDNLKKFAGELGLNQQDFDTCLDSGKYTQAVKDDTDTGRAVSVRGTPHTFVNGIAVEGAQPFEVFKNLIESNLK